MASFPLKMHIFLPHLLNPKFENVSLALHPRNFVRREHWRRTITVQKVFLYDPTLIHITSVMDTQTGDRRETEDNMVPSTSTA